MVDVIGIKFRDTGKMYYFDPVDFEIAAGDHVIVETAKGIEYGVVTMGRHTVSGKEIVPPLRKVLRLATEEDEKVHRDNLDKKDGAMEKCQEKIDKHGLEMKLVDVEYAFDNSKVIFYFTADGRIDFRELVKDLASVFRMRIELRQIGVRDEVKMMGGIGNCGRGLCCHDWLQDFQPVSIKMAKQQNLSLNPTKISGICGRLMCCLKYENDLYGELRKGMPNVGDKVLIEEGEAVVVECNILEEKIKCRLMEETSRDDGEDAGTTSLSTEVYVCHKGEFSSSKGKHGRRVSKPTKSLHHEGAEATHTEEKTHKEKRHHAKEPGKEEGKKNTDKKKRGGRSSGRPKRQRRPKNKGEKQPNKGDQKNLVSRPGERQSK